MAAALSARTQVEAVELGLRHAVASFIGIGVVGVALSGLGRGDAERQGLTAALLALWLVVLVRAVRGRGGAGTAVVLGGAALAPLVLIGAPAPDGVQATIAAIPTMIAAVAAVLIRRIGPALALAGALIAAQLVAGAIRLGVAGSALWALPVVTVAAMAFGTRVELLRAAERADRTVAEQRRAEVALTRTRAAAGAQLSWQGLLHDEVAAALRAASTPGVSRLEVRLSAAESVAAVERLGADTPLGRLDVMAALRELAAGAATPVEVDGPLEVLLPSAAAAALVGAVAEALRNVDRHAGASGARVEVVGGEDTVTVCVVDDGAGFAPPSRLPAGGLRLSVVERMTQVGGRAEVTSTRGGGTTVELSWSPVEPAPSDRLGSWVGPRDARRITTVTALPALVGAGVLAAAQGFTGPVGRFGALWYAAVVAATTLTVARGRPIRRLWAPIAMAVVAVGGALVLLAHYPAAQWSTEGLWPLVAIGPLLLLIALRRPVWVGAVAFVALELGLVVVAVRARVGFDLLLAAMVAGAYLVLVGWFVARTRSALAAVVDQAAADERDQVLAAWERVVRREVHGPRLARLEPLVLPFLRALADGSLSAEDEAVRSWAWLLEQSVRDELHLPEVLDADTRALVRAARAAGCRIRFQADAVAGSRRDAICAIVRAALSGTALPRELTVSVYVTSAPPTLAVVAVPGDPARAEQLRAVAGERIVVLQDEVESTWAEIHLPTPAVPPEPGDDAQPADEALDAVVGSPDEAPGDGRTMSG